MTRVAITTSDALTARMAGPAIRAWHMAEELSKEHEVRLVTTATCDVPPHPRFSVTHVDEASIRDLEAWCEVLVFQGFFLYDFPSVRLSSKVLVADVYDPMHLEQLEQTRGHLSTDERAVAVWSTTRVLNDQLLRGDFFVCASTKQRDYWLGQLSALGRVNVFNYENDPTLEALIAVAPFGLPDKPPTRTGPGLRQRIPGIGPDDPVILWGGGIYNWFDPLTLVRAVDRLRHRLPNVRLVFMGLTHPNPNLPYMHMPAATRALADELGLTGRHVLFNEEWVPYDDRQNFLLDADIGVSTHFHHVETAFAFRTRVLDYIWASLPVVSTDGDALAELIERRGLGLTVPPEDVEALEDALHRLLTHTELAAGCRANLAAVAPEYEWSRTLAPLAAFCRAPKRAPDHDEPALALELQRARAAVALEQPGWRRDAVLVARHLRRGGPALLVRKAVSRVRHVAAGRK